MFKTLKLFAAMIVSTVIVSGNAMALPVNDLFFPGEINQVSDNSGEYLIDRDGNGTLDVGDSLRGTFDIQTIEGLSSGNESRVGANGNNELAGIFEAEVIAKVDSGDVDAAGNTLYNYLFGPSASFAAEFSLPAGAMIIAFDDPTVDYNRLGTIANAEATATDGTQVLVVGFAGDGDEIWSAQGPDNPSVVGRTVTPATALGTFNYQLSVLSEGFADVDFTEAVPVSQPGMGIGPQNGLVEFNGSGSILGTFGTSSEYDVFNNIDAIVNVVEATQVPEPNTLAMLMMALGLMGVTIRMRRQS